MKLPFVSRAKYERLRAAYERLLALYEGANDLRAAAEARAEPGPLISWEDRKDIYDRYLANLAAASAAARRHRVELAAERDRYERLALKLAPPDPAPLPAQEEPEPLPALIEDALTALRLTGAERAVEAAAAREMLRQRLPVEDVVATLWRGGPREAGVTFEH